MKNICWLCPELCNFNIKTTGKCKSRYFDGEKIVSNPAVSCICVDKIEKRPFSNFCPEKDFLSVGFTGCPLVCEWCANFNVSQELSVSTVLHTPEELVKMAIEKSVTGIVFTYSEPLVHMEFLEGVYEASRGTDLKLAVKTNGHFNVWAMEVIGLKYDAFNVDVKGNDEVYKMCGGTLGLVKRNTENLLSLGTVVEISYLVTPMTVDNYDFHKEIAKWLSSLDKNIFIHLIKFFPYNGFSESYDYPRIEKIKEIMSEYCKNVSIFEN